DAALGHDDVLQHRRQAELLEYRNVGGDRPQHHADARLLHEGIDPEAAHARRRDGEVAFLRRFELGRLLVVHDAAHELHRVLRRQPRFRYRLDPAIDLDRRWKAGGDEKVGAFLLDEELEQLVNECGGAFAFHPGVSSLRRPRTTRAAMLPGCYMNRSLFTARLRASATLTM